MAETPTPATAGLSLAALLGSGAFAALLPLLGSLFQGGDPRAKLIAQMLQLLSPQSIGQRTNDLFSQYQQSPAAGANAVLASNAGNAAQMSAASSGAGAGITSGLDVLSRAAAAGVGGRTLAQINSDQYTKSRQDAIQSILAGVQGMGSVGPSPNYAAQFGGAGLQFFGPLLAEYLRKGKTAPGTTGASTGGGWGGGSGGNVNTSIYDPLGGMKL